MELYKDLGQEEDKAELEQEESAEIGQEESPVEKKNIPQLIVNVLLTGDSLKSTDIARKAGEISGRELAVQDISNTLSKITDPTKCDLGNFVQRKKEGKGFLYSMVDEALKLTEDEAYGLTLKIGQNRYTLDQAVMDYPELEKFITKKNKPKVKLRKKPAAKKPAEPPVDESAETEPGPTEIVAEQDAGIEETKSAEPNVKSKSVAETEPIENKAKNEIGDFIERFLNRPKKYAGQEFWVSVVFYQKPTAALDEICTCFDLPIGDTLFILGTFEKSSDFGAFYAAEKTADFLENIELGKPYKIKVRTIFGIYKEVHYTDSLEQIVSEESEKGFLILDSK